MVAGLVVTLCHTGAEFEALKKSWNSLLERSHSRSVFLTWEWQYTWWCHLGQDVGLSLVIVRSVTGELVGIAPFCVTKSGILPVHVLSFMGTTYVSSEYLDIISHPEYEKEVAMAVAQVFLDDKGSWDLVVRTDLNDSSVTLRYLKDLLQSPKILIEQSLCQSCPYLSLPTSSDMFRAGLGSETRASLKRRTKKLGQLGAVVESIKSVDEVPAQLHTLFSLHEKRWRLRGLRGNFREESVRRFHLDVARLFLGCGWLGLYTLQTNDNTIACLYGFNYARKYYYFQAGFDPSWANHSPGFVLMGRCIEDAIAQGLDEFDYLRGMEPYKRRWTKTQRQTWCLTIIPEDRTRGRLHYRSKQIVKRSKAIVKRALAAFSSGAGR
ncbi:MAG: GNAT family N-acetyltransferase [Rectinemataceae bacterium]|nr:GNAT family N-acetyltransferase [Rectinemataceae bacterium]